MDDQTRMLLERRIALEFDNLSSWDSECKEKTEAIHNLAALYKLKIEESRIDCDYDERTSRRFMEKEQQYLKFVIEAADIILPILFYAFWMKKGFQFEENGTFTSTTFRGLFQKFKLSKK